MLTRFFSGSDVFGATHYGKPKQRAYETQDLSRRLSARNERRRGRKRGYLIAIQLSTIVSALLVMMVLRIDPIGEAEQAVVVSDVEEMVMLEEIQQTRQLDRPPPPPRPPAPVEVPNDEVLEEEDIAIDASIDFEEPSALPPPPVAAVSVEEEEEERDIFVVVEEMPEIVGGLERLAELIRYPEVAIQAGIEGTVFVQIIIDESGRPREPEVVRSASKLLNEAAKDAVMQLEFVPGRQRGRAVQVQMVFPVRFNLVST